MNHKVIVLRGNSGSGKSTIAYELRKHTKPMAIVIEQDLFRQKIVAQKGEDSRLLAKHLILTIIKEALKNNRDVIIEGIFREEKWKDLFDELTSTHPSENYFFYFDISLEETKKRHTTRLKRHEFSSDVMDEWFKNKDFLVSFDEHVIDEKLGFEDTLAVIKNTVGYK